LFFTLVNHCMVVDHYIVQFSKQDPNSAEYLLSWRYCRRSSGIKQSNESKNLLII